MLATTKRTAVQSQPVVLTVSVEDMAKAREVRRALNIMRGVTKVYMPRQKRMTGIERARLDVKEGRVYRYDCLDDFIREIENG